MIPSFPSPPPEWAPQRALWVGWPHIEEEWGADFAAAQGEIAAFIRAASGFVPVKVAAGSEAAETSAREMGLAEHAEIVRVPAGDIWLRDTGPIMALGAEELLAHCFAFNGWGGKYDMPGDTETAHAIAEEERTLPLKHGMVLEGGSLDWDGKGVLLTTEECLLNDNRNPSISRNGIETLLTRILGVKQFVWIERGLDGDHTDGHIDNIARFCAPGHVICQGASSADDPHLARYMEIEEQLRAAGLKVSTIPSPGRVLDAEGEVLPASHMNFTITNGAVIVPIYNEAAGRAACAALRPHFLGREIIGLPANAILRGGGGAFHCMTREVPQKPERVR